MLCIAFSFDISCFLFNTGKYYFHLQLRVLQFFLCSKTGRKSRFDFVVN